MTYDTVLNKDLLDQLGIYYIDALNRKSNYYNNQYNNISIAITAAVNAYGIIHINKLKLHILEILKGKIYYTDTDSIVTNVQLPAYFVNSKKKVNYNYKIPYKKLIL